MMKSIFLSKFVFFSEFQNQLEEQKFSNDLQTIRRYIHKKLTNYLNSADIYDSFAINVLTSYLVGDEASYSSIISRIKNLFYNPHKDSQSEIVNKLLDKLFKLKEVLK